MTDHADQFPNATRGDNSAPQAISSTVLKRIQKKAEHAVAAGIFAGTAIGCCGFVAQYGGYAGRGHHAIAIGWSLALIVGALVVFLLQRRPLKQREMAALLDAVPALSLSAQARMTAASARLDGRPISVRMAADVLDTHDVDVERSRPPKPPVVSAPRPDPADFIHADLLEPRPSDSPLSAGVALCLVVAAVTVGYVGLVVVFDWLNWLFQLAQMAERDSLPWIFSEEPAQYAAMIGVGSIAIAIPAQWLDREFRTLTAYELDLLGKAELTIPGRVELEEAIAWRHGKPLRTCDLRKVMEANSAEIRAPGTGRLFMDGYIPSVALQRFHLFMRLVFPFIAAAIVYVIRNSRPGVDTLEGLQYEEFTPWLTIFTFALSIIFGNWIGIGVRALDRSSFNRRGGGLHNQPPSPLP